MTATTRRPNVLFVTHVADRTGAPRILRYLVEHLGKQVTAELLVLRDGDQFGAFECLAPTHLLGRDQLPDLCAFDVLYVNSTGCLPTLQRIGVVVPDAVRYVLHVHEIGAGLDGIEPSLTGRSPDVVIACASAVADDIRTRWSLASEVHYEFIDVEQARRRAGADPVGRAASVSRMLEDARARGVAIVGAVGTRWPYKGPDLFWRIAARISERLDRFGRSAFFIWIGGSETDMAPAARAERDRIPGSRRLEVAKVADPLPLVRLLDVLLVTGRDDPFPLACLEAAALSVPAVAFDAGGIHELLDPNGGRVVPAFDVDQFASAASAWLHDEEARRQAGVQLARAVETAHDIGVAIPALLEVVLGADQVASWS